MHPVIPLAPTPTPPPTAGDTRRQDFEHHKLSRRLHRQVGQAITDFNMIGAGDKVMVCVSGGKDSYAMLDILIGLRERAPIDFDLVAVNLDQKQPGFPADVLPEYLRSRGVAFHIEERDTYSIVKRVVPEGQTMCALCSRLRRGILYRVAGELGATRIALGHHRDDIVTTLLLNMFFGARMKGMPPKLVSDDGRHVVIRPMAYVAEADLVRWAVHRRFPIIPCTLCGSQDNLQRVQVKQMIQDWERQYPGRIDNMLTAMGRVTPSHLMDRNLFPFATIEADGRPDSAGDKAFDVEPLTSAVEGIRLAQSARRPAGLARDDDGAGSASAGQVDPADVDGDMEVC